jgi:putative glutamine amidotransferase
MVPASTSGNAAQPLRIGIPWRTTPEQRQGERKKLEYYFASVRKAGAEPVDVKLDQAPGALRAQLADLDGFVLPGSPADVNPDRYFSPKHPRANEIDTNREETDSSILEHAFEADKPVLAICFGCQMLNVYQKGSLIQDLKSERPESLAHGDTDLPPGSKRGDIRHPAEFTTGSLLARLNGGTAGAVNSSHHQAIDKPGRELAVTAHAADGTIEAIEWTGGRNWVVGVQWHPERMPDDALAQKLFAEFVAAADRARSARDSLVHKL